MALRKFHTRPLLLVLLIGFFSLFAFSRAQTTNQTDYSGPSLPSLIPGLEEQIDVNLSPKNPAPNQPVNISLSGFGTDLNRATISWIVNGTVQKTGFGVTTFVYTAGSAGSVANISVVIVPVNGNRVTKEIAIAPASVDIVWETSSYTPPFYKGKRLYPPQETLTFVALPNLVSNGVAVDPNALVYKWSLNNSIVGDKSGFGKRTFSVTGDILNQPISVSVDVSLVKNNISGSGAVTVAPENPQVLFYEDSPLLGILFNHSLLNQFNLTGAEVTLAAYPYYFSARSPSDISVNYTWAINDSALSLSPHQNNVVFRKPDGADGQSKVGVAAVNPKNFLQSAANTLMINFQKNNQNVSF